MTTPVLSAKNRKLKLWFTQTCQKPLRFSRLDSSSFHSLSSGLPSILYDFKTDQTIPLNPAEQQAKSDSCPFGSPQHHLWVNYSVGLSKIWKPPLIRTRTVNFAKQQSTWSPSSTGLNIPLTSFTRLFFIPQRSTAPKRLRDNLKRENKYRFGERMVLILGLM